MNTPKIAKSAPFRLDGSSRLERPAATLPLTRPWLAMSLAFEVIPTVTHRDIGLIHSLKDTLVKDCLKAEPLTSEKFVKDIFDLSIKYLLDMDPNEYFEAYTTDDMTVEKFGEELAVNYLNSTAERSNNTEARISLHALYLKDVYESREEERKRRDNKEQKNEEFGKIGSPEGEESEDEDATTEETKSSVMRAIRAAAPDATEYFVNTGGNNWTVLAGVTTIRGAKISAARMSNEYEHKEVKVGVKQEGGYLALFVRPAGSKTWAPSTDKEIYTPEGE